MRAITVADVLEFPTSQPEPRHYYATALISAGADPTDVQKALRHSSLRITLETYVHWWPKKERRRNVVGTALQAVAARQPKTQDQS
jgi:integrase